MSMKLFFGVLGLLVSTALFAATYDGVWTPLPQNGTAEDEDYWVLYQNGNQLLMVSNWSEMDGWEAFLGTIDGSRAQLRTLTAPDDTRVGFTLNFSSPTTGTFVLNSCTGSECDGDPQLGVEYPIRKIF